MTYYLVTIKGEMISGRLITKKQPTQGFLQTICKAGKKSKGETVTIEPLEWKEISEGAYPITDENLSENQIIRKYLDNLKD